MRRRPRPFELRDGLRTGLRTGCRHAPERPRSFHRSAANILPRHLRRLPRREASGRVSGSPLPASELTKTARAGHETTHTYARSLMIFHQRKRLDLCLSSTFNEKRQFLFDGRDLSKSDLRLKGHVVHDVKKNGVHCVSFSDLSVGATRQIPQSEIQNAK